MSAFGPEQTLVIALPSLLFWGKADITLRKALSLIVLSRRCIRTFRAVLPITNAYSKSSWLQ